MSYDPNMKYRYPTKDGKLILLSMEQYRKIIDRFPSRWTELREEEVLMVIGKKEPKKPDLVDLILEGKD